MLALFNLKDKIFLFILFFLIRTSGVTDHYALDDQHALEIARNIVKNLNIVKNPQVKCPNSS
jgi:acetyl-CoA carboxylase carboxyltransferase component